MTTRNTTSHKATIKAIRTKNNARYDATQARLKRKALKKSGVIGQDSWMG